MDKTSTKKEKRKVQRSPGYPMLSLEEAIQKIKILWEKDKNKTIPIEAVYEHLGYKKIGGYASRVIAAMKKFGLIYEKQNDIILTDEAVDLALHDESDAICSDTVRKLALKPPIYEKLFNEYDGHLPSDATLKVKLIKDYEFNPNKVNGFLSDFRKTIEFANLRESEIMGQEKTPTEEQKMRRTNLPIKPAVSLNPSTFVTEAGEREIANYPIGKGLKARILVSGASFVTSDTIDKLISLLELNKDDLPEIADFDLHDKNETS